MSEIATKTPDEILQEICGGRADLLELGQQFNKCAQVSSEGEDLQVLNDAVCAIFELEGIALNPSEKELVENLDKLNWDDNQVIEFLRLKGGIN